MHDEDHSHEHGIGHNRPREATQWQVPHRAESNESPPDRAHEDLDLVEMSFVENYARASDPTSFLRLANIPFVGVTAEGRRLHLLRVEIEHKTDVGAISPLLGGQGMRYDPLPQRMVSQRRRLVFIYHDGHEAAGLSFAEARALRDESGTSSFELAR